MIKALVANTCIHFAYTLNNNHTKISFDKNYSNEHVDVVYQLNETESRFNLKLLIKPHTKLTIDSLKIVMKHQYDVDERIFMNGYQSWTDSREFFIDEKMKSISKLAAPLMNKYQFDKYGDYRFKTYTNRKGDFHGYTYAYLRNNETYSLIGSLTEKNGFTIINTSVLDETLTIEKECKNLTIDSDYAAFDLVFVEGDETYVFDTYFEQMKIIKPKASPMTGWTSWYNYYQNINEEIIQRNLNAFSQANKSIDIFQIDDGYQTFVGDWLDIDDQKFPHGMKNLASDIHDKGYKAGLWLAPFVCETNSKLFRDHKEWILKDDKGQYLLAGSNWSRFYALNLDHPEVRLYIKHVFHTVLEEWGYDLVKLDFLYAVCLIPSATKTRGQIMTDAMIFLRECAGNKLILGCGVPLGPSFGLVDYCRIGCDVGLDWDDKPFMRLLHRERVSTLNAINNSMGRRQLNNRAFINDPDVFFLRENNMSLTKTQKETLAFVNKLFGSLIFTSDDITLYNDEQNQFFDKIMTRKCTCVIEVIPNKNGVIKVRYTQEKQNWIAHINMSGEIVNDLDPYETKVSKE